MTILAQITSDEVLDTAYEWLCRRRRDYSANSDVWALRRHWPHEKEQIKGELLSGNYRFSLLTRITLKDGEDIDLWSARDALVLKAPWAGAGQAPAGLAPMHPPQGPRRCEVCRARGPRSSRRQPLCAAHRREVLLRLGSTTCCC